jgi:hypothetical protein
MQIGVALGTFAVLARCSHSGAWAAATSSC